MAVCIRKGALWFWWFCWGRPHCTSMQCTCTGKMLIFKDNRCLSLTIHIPKAARSSSNNVRKWWNSTTNTWKRLSDLVAMTRWPALHFQIQLLSATLSAPQDVWVCLLPFLMEALLLGSWNLLLGHIHVLLLTAYITALLGDISLALFYLWLFFSPLL